MEKFLARQPIFNSKQVIYGYELLHRSSLENYFAGWTSTRPLSRQPIVCSSLVWRGLHKGAARF